MSFFSKIFGTSQDNRRLENDLEETYTRLLVSQGLPEGQVRAMVRSEISNCREQAKIEGTDKLPNNWGDEILRLASEGNKEFEEKIKRKREEGVRDEDVREFWNLHDLQRRMVTWSENVMRVTFARSMWKPGLSKKEEADLAKLIFKTFPKYGDLADINPNDGNDRALPHELRGRIDRWKIRMMQQGRGEEIKKMLDRCTSFNALVRDQMQKGNL